MDYLDYTIILISYIVSSAIKGLTGIGFSTSCLPIMALRLDLKVAIPLAIIPSIVSNLTIMIQAGCFREAVKRFWPLYLFSIPGLLIGVMILAVINVDTAKIALGVVLVLYALLALSNKSFSLSDAWERKLKMPVGLFTGFINGLTGSQVMPVLPYLLSLNLSRNSFVQAINISFTFSSLIMLFSMNRLGYLSPNTFLTAIFGLIPVLVIVYFCSKIRNRIPKELYRNLVLFFILIIGSVLSFKSILSLITVLPG